MSEGSHRAIIVGTYKIAKDNPQAVCHNPCETVPSLLPYQTCHGRCSWLKQILRVNSTYLFLWSEDDALPARENVRSPSAWSFATVGLPFHKIILYKARGDGRGAVLHTVHTSAVSIWSKDSQALSKIRPISWASLLKLSANWIVSMISHCKGICCRGILRRVRWPIMKLGRAMLGRLALAGLAQ